jgi:chromosomal replication initiator protein
VGASSTTGAPALTFESFVAGPSTRFAYEAAFAVAEAPARVHNPLLVHGRVGVGKTHLLRAIATHVGTRRPELSVRYVTAETFLIEWIDALRTKDASAFGRRYRRDVLLVDDLHLLMGKPRIQQELALRLASAVEAGRQVVLASGPPLDGAAGVEGPLLARFEAALVAHVGPPDLDTRIAILRRRLDRAGRRVDPEVVRLVASSFPTDVRRLEGAMTRVLAFEALAL